MITIGGFNTLRAKRQTGNGYYLVDVEDEEVLLPNKYIPEDFAIDDLLEVFVYKDSEDRIVCCTDEPYAIVGDFAYLYVKDVNSVGAFLDWGLEKDLFVPYSEQFSRMQQDECYVVFIYLDDQTGRIVASSKLNRFFLPIEEGIKEGDEVEILVYDESDLGFSAVIDDMSTGLIYKSEVHEEMRIGDRRKAYIKTLREDGKIDIRIQAVGAKHIDAAAAQIIKKMEENGGKLNLYDKSPSEDVRDMMGMSKKTFKKAVGGLYKRKLIEIGDKCIFLAKK